MFFSYWIAVAVCTHSHIHMRIHTCYIRYVICSWVIHTYMCGYDGAVLVRQFEVDHIFHTLVRTNASACHHARHTRRMQPTSRRLETRSAAHLYIVCCMGIFCVCVNFTLCAVRESVSAPAAGLFYARASVMSHGAIWSVAIWRSLWARVSALCARSRGSFMRSCTRSPDLVFCFVRPQTLGKIMSR